MGPGSDCIERLVFFYYGLGTFDDGLVDATRLDN